MNNADMSKEYIKALREAAMTESDGYAEHLAHGGKGDPAEELWIEALTAGANAMELLPEAEDAAIVRHGIPVVHYEGLFNSDGKLIQTYPSGYECPFCGDPDIKEFCPTCGAKMGGAED